MASSASPHRSQRAWHWVSIALALGCGLLLRAVLVHRFALVQGDSLVYGRIAANWLQHGVYSLGNVEDGPLRPTLIRLPGYPLFLAAVFRLFGVANYHAVLAVQVAVDLVTCALIAIFVHDHAGTRAARVALWGAAVCPFTATYCAAPLTETLSIFCVALAMLAASRALASKSQSWRWLLALAFALAYSILLRPDGGLLAAAVFVYLAWLAWRGSTLRAWLPRMTVVAILVLLPLVPWSMRNWRTFHVFQPLAPRYANDPGELPESGYKSWVKTWFGDAVSNEEFYWCADDCPLQIALLPSRAFDDAAQRAQTAALLDQVNQALADGNIMTAAMDAQFSALALHRRQSHALRTRVELPLMRLTDMLLRPRTELFPVPARWWQWRVHVRMSLFAALYAVLNAGYLVGAAIAFLRRRVPLAGMMLAYFVLRCLLLLTLENAEPRYTLEFFPIEIAAVACLFQRASGAEAPF